MYIEFLGEYVYQVIVVVDDNGFVFCVQFVDFCCVGVEQICLIGLVGFDCCVKEEFLDVLLWSFLVVGGDCVGDLFVKVVGGCFIWCGEVVGEVGKCDYVVY